MDHLRQKKLLKNVKYVFHERRYRNKSVAENQFAQSALETNFVIFVVNIFCVCMCITEIKAPLLKTNFKVRESKRKKYESLQAQ